MNKRKFAIIAGIVLVVFFIVLTFIFGGGATGTDDAQPDGQQQQ